MKTPVNSVPILEALAMTLIICIDLGALFVQIDVPRDSMVREYVLGIADKDGQVEDDPTFFLKATSGLCKSLLASCEAARSPMHMQSFPAGYRSECAARHVRFLSSGHEFLLQTTLTGP